MKVAWVREDLEALEDEDKVRTTDPKGAGDTGWDGAPSELVPPSAGDGSSAG